MTKKFQIIVLIAILITYLFTALASLSHGHAWGDDFAAYIMQARSILHGTEKQFFVQNSFTISNSSSIIGPTVYPWGFPLFLAIFYAIFGLNPLGLKVINIFFFLFSLMALFWIFKKRLPLWEVILLVAVLAFNPRLLSIHNDILSDITFSFFSTLSILLIDRLICDHEDSPASTISNLFLGLFIFIATFVRTNGIFLLGVLIGCQAIVIRRQWKAAAVDKKILFRHLIPYLVFAILWFLSIVILPNGDTSYFQYFSLQSIGENVRSNSIYYYHLVEIFFTSTSPTRTTQILYGFLLAFFLLGIVARLEKDYAFIIYSIIYIGLLLAWPEVQDARFLLPIFPFFIYYSYQGMKVGFSNLHGHYRKAGLFITVLFWSGILVLFAIQSGRLVRANLAAGRQEAGPFDMSSTEMFQFIRTNTPPDSVIVFFKPRAMRLMTDRNAVEINTCNKLSIGNYIVLDPESDPGLQVSVDKINTCGLKLIQSFKNDSFIVYQLIK